MKARVLCLEELKKMCDKFLELFLVGIDEDIAHYGEDVEVRFINDDGSFGYGSVCNLFFYHDRMYYWTQRKTQKEHLTLDDFELYGSLEILEIFTDIKIFQSVLQASIQAIKMTGGRSLYR